MDLWQSSHNSLISWSWPIHDAVDSDHHHSSRNGGTDGLIRFIISIRHDDNLLITSYELWPFSWILPTEFYHSKFLYRCWLLVTTSMICNILKCLTKFKYVTMNPGCGLSPTQHLVTLTWQDSNQFFISGRRITPNTWRVKTVCCCKLMLCGNKTD